MTLDLKECFRNLDLSVLHQYDPALSNASGG